MRGPVVGLKDPASAPGGAGEGRYIGAGSKGSRFGSAHAALLALRVFLHVLLFR